MQQAHIGSKPTEGPRDWNHPVKLGKNQPQVKTNQWPPFRQQPTSAHTSGTSTRFYTEVFSSKNSTFQSVQHSSTVTNISINHRLSLQPPPSSLQTSPGEANCATHKPCESCVKRADMHAWISRDSGRGGGFPPSKVTAKSPFSAPCSKSVRRSGLFASPHRCT